MSIERQVECPCPGAPFAIAHVRSDCPHFGAAPEPQLKPCQFCGGACSVQIFTGAHIEREATLWMCSKHKYFGGTCPDENAYLSEEAWNTRTPATELERELYEALKNIAFAGGNSCQFATDLDCLRQMESLARVALARAGGGVK